MKRPLDITVREALARAEREGGGWIYIHGDDGKVAAVVLSRDRAEREIEAVTEDSPRERWAHTHYDESDINIEEGTEPWREMARDLKMRSTCVRRVECGMGDHDPPCQACMRGFNLYLADQPGRTWENWFSLKPWVRETWRREAGAQ